MLRSFFPKSMAGLGRISRRLSLIALATIVLTGGLWWAGSWAGAPMVSHPAHGQIQQILTPLIASEAEHVMGAYYPGIGAMISLDLLRGPNSVPGQPAYVGTRDWAIYLMQSFGGQLTAVPPGEKIAFSIDFYDYDVAVYHQLVLIAQAAQVQDPGSYEYWLDGQPYDQQTGALPQNAGVTSAPQANPTQAAPTSPAVTESGMLPGFSQSGGTVDFGDPSLVDSFWQPMSGAWQTEAGGYVQTELGQYDLISILRQPLPESYDIQVSAQLLDGQMGAGLVFNTPDPTLRNDAYMISYTGEGTYLQWGRYDGTGIFQFQGGASVPNGGDGQPHLLGVRVTPAGYSVRLDGTELATVTDFSPIPRSYAGLLASTSRVRFDDLVVRLDDAPQAEIGASPAMTSTATGFISTQWVPLAGRWVITDGGYEQTDVGLYDLISFFLTPVTNTTPISYSVSADLQWVEGQMGGGLVFAGADPQSRANAQMISFTDNGNYLQWGYYDSGSLFQFQGGATVIGAGDGQIHRLAVQVNGESYTVSYDGGVVGADIPLAVPNGPYAGLLASTSHVRFTSFQLMTDHSLSGDSGS